MRTRLDTWWTESGPRIPVAHLALVMSAAVLAGYVDAMPAAAPVAASAQGVSSLAASRPDAAHDHTGRLLAGVVACADGDWPEPEAFDLPPQEAIDFFADANVVTPEQFDLLDSAAKANAFTAAGISDLTILREIKSRLDTALSTGETANEWLGKLEERLGALGVGEHAELPLHRLRGIYRHNTSHALMAGRWQQFQRTAESRPYLQYITVGDSRVRPEHAALDGMIRPIDDPIWQRYYPPWDFGCRCQVVSISLAEMEAEGLSEWTDDDVMQSYEQAAAGSINTSAGGMPPPRKGFGNPAEFFAKPAPKAKPKAKPKYHTYEEAAAATNKWAEGLSEKDMAIFRGYTEGDSKVWNEPLRHGTQIRPEAKKQIGRLSEMLHEAPKLETVVYRGLPFATKQEQEDFLTKLETGAVTRLPAFTSTSMDREKAKSFAFIFEDKAGKPQATGGGAAILHIRSKAGVALGNLSKYEQEQEVLFNKGSKFFVESVAPGEAPGIVEIVLQERT